MPITAIIPTKSELAFAKRITKESTGVKVTFGRTNGQTVLHANGFTLKHEGEWESCPLNMSFKRAENGRSEAGKSSVAREQEINALNESIANRDAV